MWTRNIDDVLLSLWFNGPEFPDKLMKPAKTKTQMMSNPVSKEETSSLPPPPPPTTTTSIAPTRIFSTCCKEHVASWYRIG